MKNTKLINRRKNITQDSSSALLHIALEKEGGGGGEKFLQHGVFVFGYSRKEYPGRTGLNFAERTKLVAVVVV